MYSGFIFFRFTFIVTEQLQIWQKIIKVLVPQHVFHFIKHIIKHLLMNKAEQQQNKIFYFMSDLMVVS